MVETFYHQLPVVAVFRIVNGEGDQELEDGEESSLHSSRDRPLLRQSGPHADHHSHLLTCLAASTLRLCIPHSLAFSRFFTIIYTPTCSPWISSHKCCSLSASLYLSHCTFVQALPQPAPGQAAHQVAAVRAAKRRRPRRRARRAREKLPLQIQRRKHLHLHRPLPACWTRRNTPTATL